MAQILLITGWGGGTGLLEPLQQQLQQCGHTVTLMNIFDAFDPVVMQDRVQQAMTADVIIGWSLGGQLALLLAHALQQETGDTLPVITLASNPCFVAQPNWECAMPQETFAAFKAGFLHDPASTLKRFGLLVTKGVTSAKHDWTFMQSLLRAQPISLLQQGLKLLEQLNLVDTLKSYSGNQLYVFARQDALVPCQIVEKMQYLASEKIKVITFHDAAHSFPFTKVIETCKEIEKFIQTSV